MFLSRAAGRAAIHPRRLPLPTPVTRSLMKMGQAGLGEGRVRGWKVSTIIEVLNPKYHIGCEFEMFIRRFESNQCIESDVVPVV